LLAESVSTDRHRCLPWADQRYRDPFPYPRRQSGL